MPADPTLAAAAAAAALALAALAAGIVSHLRRREEAVRAEARLEEIARQVQALGTDLRGAQAQAREEQARHAAGLEQAVSAQLRQGAENLARIHEGLLKGMGEVHRQVTTALSASTEQLERRFEQLTRATDTRLREIGGQVEGRLQEGFKETTATFADVQKRLALIDQAQRHIQELSHNVVSLQEVLADKRSRGAFGEVQLAALVRNVLPEGAFALQRELSNGTRVDCLLYLPEPTGTVAVDAKFPLENFHRMCDPDAPAAERARAARLFKADVKRHIQDVADKYVIPGETADGAVLFLPAEAVFAEIHAHHPDLVELAWRRRVWLTSPTTLMAILTTARAVLKDAATRRQLHVIQDHLVRLAEDFDRFQKRMDNLARHIRQAGKDVEEVHTSARKITRRFEKIEKVELAPAAPAPELGEGPQSGEDDEDEP
ncbi:DNA recombination protein RmuC [Dissulfurirhabdus thermomarina]|uniref:DNA recombination protein RmuC n=1 Tax=Dissulfurirhabdus thermomarina TaxID=1765737 RepID=A0A6N9TQ53_DISTH|nr:DNA recombination protein RmuC [Dissulfurirhabdus thermomarina]NDY43401.1 DNA recombination protein RmuC [Dissulfurirhabdus thermomarina]NMX23639.1 DNA recombination protein RmuC [Dissulfurirhabdus thermomarina]